MPFHNILVPVDLSEPSIRALRLAVSTARTSRAHLTLLHVGVVPVAPMTDAWVPAVSAPLVELTDQMVIEARKTLERVQRDEVPSDIDARVVVREGFVPDEIVEEARVGGHDLVVMGTHGHTGLERVLLGSVAERVIRGCPIPVLVTR
jgi:nucleotide-binding universal stress UspA family protein